MTSAEQVAAMSGLLRRAARQCDAAADRLQGEEWLAWLDGDDPARPYTAGAGRLLLDGGFRPDVGPAEVAALRPLARVRFLQLLEAGARGPGADGRSAGVNHAQATRHSPRRTGHRPSRTAGTAIPLAGQDAGGQGAGDAGKQWPGRRTQHDAVGGSGRGEADAAEHPGNMPRDASGQEDGR